MTLLFNSQCRTSLLFNSLQLACYSSSSRAPVERGAPEPIEKTTLFTQVVIDPTAYAGGFYEVQNRRRSLLREECKRHNLGNISDEFDATRLPRHVKLLYSDNHKVNDIGDGKIALNSIFINNNICAYSSGGLECTTGLKLH